MQAGAENERSDMEKRKGQTRGEAVQEFLHSLGRETLMTSWELVRITVPIIIITKILEELGLIAPLSSILEPVMASIGLPGSLGLVWATAMLTSIYGGIAVFAALAPELTLTAAQITVLYSVILIAHSLPLELSISKKAGAALLPIACLRIGGAILYGLILSRLCSVLEIWQEPAELFFQTAAADPGIGHWAVNQGMNLAMIVGVIFCIVVAMRILRSIGLLSLFERLLSPVLPFFGMSRRAAPLAVVGMIMGIGYGGALIIRETCSGQLDRTEVFNAMALLGLCHALVEDTLLLMAIGGKLGGIFWGRILFSLGIVFLLVWTSRYLAERKEERAGRSV